MQNLRWVNQSHPQTLHIATILLYIDAVFSLLGGVGGGPLLAIATAGAGVGIANDKRVAWYVGIAVSAIVPLLLVRHLWNAGLLELLDFEFLLQAAFPVAQLIALVHPMSSSHVKTWFE